SVCTIRIPLDVSKIIVRYNSLVYYDVGIRIFRLSLMLMVGTGVLSFLFFYFGSGWLASKFIYSSKHGNSAEDIKQVMQMLSFSLLIIPFMSVVRGFFQGNQIMEPTAISQIVEQIVRIVFVLASAFLIIKVYHSGIVLAVSFAAFAAFVGGIASCIVLFMYWRRRKASMVDHGPVKQHVYVSNKELVIELFSYAGPFILVVIAIPLYQLVDSFTFNKAMVIGGYEEIITVSMA